MQQTWRLDARTPLRAWQFARRNPRLTAYSTITILFVIWAVCFTISTNRQAAAQEAFERSPEGRAQAAAHDREISDKVDLDLAQMFVKARLRDPDSAQFMAVHMVHRSSENGVCGFVNARNGLGGMVGNEAFAVIDTHVIMASDASSRELSELDHLCYGR